MIYSVDLKTAGLLAGLVLLASHLFGFFKPGECRKLLVQFPRSRVAGTILLAVAAIWSFWLISWMDLGEFAGLRKIILIGIIVGAVLGWLYVEEFLAVRALGMLALLASEPLLSAAFLRPESSRLLLVVLAYAWITLGLFWVGIPWLLRDQIRWITANPARFRAAAAAGALYSMAILACALLLWR